MSKHSVVTTAPRVTAPDGDGGGAASRRKRTARCEWCSRQLPQQDGVGRRRKYCGQACRQRAYENRNALTRSELPVDAVVLSAQEHEDLADRLYQTTCAAEDVATAVAEGASPAELAGLINALLAAVRAAERIR